MAKIRRRRRISRKRRKSRRKFTSRSLYAQAPRFPLGKKRTVRTRYYEKGLTLNGGAGGISGSYVFSANGLFDPNQSGVGHQVLGFDQMMLMFDHYTVIGARIRVDMWNQDSVNAQVVGLLVNDDNTPSLDTTVSIENGSCKYKTLLPLGSGLSSRTSMTLKVNPAKFLGRSKPLSDPQLKGTISANPIEGVFFQIFCADTGIDDSGSVEFSVTLEYLVVYTEPKQLGSS